MSERLQKLIARAGICSRRAAEELIRTGKVKVDGRLAKIGQSADPVRQRITVDGKPLKVPKKFHYLLLYKPRGVITTLHDEKGRPDLRSLLKDFPHRVFPVGRLDRRSEGLLLLTDNGNLTAKLLHPRYHVVRRYRVTVQGMISAAALSKLAEGVELEDGITLPAGVKLVERTRERSRFLIDLFEGRNRQIRRMCEQLGYEVIRLIREKFGIIEIGNLTPGKWRKLRDGEVEQLRNELRGATRSLSRKKDVKPKGK